MLLFNETIDTIWNFISYANLIKIQSIQQFYYNEFYNI